MHEKKLENILNLNPQERFEYFIRTCADFEEVWGISINSQDWIIFKTDEGEMFPVWPHEEFAEHCMFLEHRDMGAKPTKISITSFLDNCIPDMIKDDVSFVVFMDEERQGHSLAGSMLKNALRKELQQYE